jgi:histidinol-phosphate aminotransferase
VIQPKPEIDTTPTAIHGALDYEELARLGLDPDQMLDFSVNSNPFGPSPRVREALHQVPVERYPDREALTLRHALAEYHGIEMENIVVGNGTAELLWLAAFAYLRPGDHVLILAPTFSEYARVAGLMGAVIEEYFAGANQHFQHDLTQLSEKLNNQSPRCVFLCNPNNPTGAVIPAEQIIELAGQHPETLFIVDEAYMNFIQPPQSLIGHIPPNILVIRSMTKDYALAGLRLGYAVGSRALIAAIAAVRPAWNTSGLAQAAGLAALQDQEYLQETLRQLREANRDFVEALRGQGWHPIESQTHYFLMLVDDAPSFRQKLMAKNIVVRDCTSFGLQEYVRIATRNPADNAIFLAALQGLSFDS